MKNYLNRMWDISLFILIGMLIGQCWNSLFYDLNVFQDINEWFVLVPAIVFVLLFEPLYYEVKVKTRIRKAHNYGYKCGYYDHKNNHHTTIKEIENEN